MNLTDKIKRKAIKLGFDLAAVTDVSQINAEHISLLQQWLQTGCAGQMEYMHRNFEKRINPSLLLKNAQSVIVVGLNYTSPNTQPPQQDKNKPAGTVANYARYEDYHPFIKNLLYELTNYISTATDEDFRFKVCVDSAPLAERTLAARAGLGFIGKNHMLINPILGPQIFLGELITTLELEPDKPIKDSCDNCDKCIVACPTGALRHDGQFNATKCISYLTIEYKDQIPSQLTEKIGDRLFGCDQCVSACPYHKKAPACTNSKFEFYNNRARLDLHQILDMTEDDFNTGFADSAIRRCGLETLKRNAEICLTNTRL